MASPGRPLAARAAANTSPVLNNLQTIIDRRNATAGTLEDGGFGGARPRIRVDAWQANASFPSMRPPAMGLQATPNFPNVFDDVGGNTAHGRFIRR